jgi:hypothetical protein
MQDFHAADQAACQAVLAKAFRGVLVLSDRQPRTLGTAPFLVQKSRAKVRSSNRNPLNLIERDLVAGTVV